MLLVYYTVHCSVDGLVARRLQDFLNFASGLVVGAKNSQEIVVVPLVAINVKAPLQPKPFANNERQLSPRSRSTYAH